MPTPEIVPLPTPDIDNMVEVLERLIEGVKVCVECASILFFNPDLTLRAPRPGELAQVQREDPHAYQALLAGQRAVRRLDRR
jgi:hypothetical protein